MAQQVEVRLIEDLDCSRSEDAVRAGLDGTGYRIGRTGGQARALPDTLARCPAAARRGGGGKGPAPAGPRATGRRPKPAYGPPGGRGQGIVVDERRPGAGEPAPQGQAP